MRMRLRLWYLKWSLVLVGVCLTTAFVGYLVSPPHLSKLDNKPSKVTIETSPADQKQQPPLYHYDSPGD